MKTIDLGDGCVHCKRDTGFGTGLFVNRVPADHQEDADSPMYKGYICPDCLELDNDDTDSNIAKMVVYAMSDMDKECFIGNELEGWLKFAGADEEEMQRFFRYLGVDHETLEKITKLWKEKYGSS